MLKSDANPIQIRQLEVRDYLITISLLFITCSAPLTCTTLEHQSKQMAHLVKVPGIIISASAIRAKATHITLQCRSCRNYLPSVPIKPGLEGYSLPRKCNTYVRGSSVPF